MKQNDPKNVDFWKKGTNCCYYFSVFTLKTHEHFTIFSIRANIDAFAVVHETAIAFDVERSKKFDGKSILFKFKCYIWNGLFESNSIFKNQGIQMQKV